MTINNTTLTMIGNYNLEIFQDDNNTTVFKITSKEGSTITFKEGKYKSVLIIETKTMLKKQFTKRRDVYYNQLSLDRLNYNMIRPTYVMKHNLYLDNNYICYVPDLFNSSSIIRLMLYDNVSEEDIEILEIYNFKEIKPLILIAQNERHYIEDYLVNRNEYDYNYNKLTTEVKVLIKILKLKLKCEYNYIKIEPDAIKYIKINNLSLDNDQVLVNMTIDLSQLRNKNKFYYNLLIVYCLIKLNETEFIYWLLEYMNNYDLCEYFDIRDDYCINSCELIL